MSIDLIVLGAKGRMGKTICSLVCEDKDLKLVAVVDRDDNIPEAAQWACPVYTNLNDTLGRIADLKNTVIIDFTGAQSSLEAARISSKFGVRHVIGSTGFTDVERAELTALAQQSTLFWSSNMSIGVNALLQFLPSLVQSLGPAYDLEIVEIHHNKKKDAPSGTAKMLGECVAEARGLNLTQNAVYAREGIIGERTKDEIGMQTLRGGDVVGVHTVYLLGPGERIEIAHHAHSRETFAQGALRAAKWLISKNPGKLYSMQDIFAAQ